MHSGMRAIQEALRLLPAIVVCMGIVVTQGCQSLSKSTTNPVIRSQQPQQLSLPLNLMDIAEQEKVFRVEPPPIPPELERSILNTQSSTLPGTTVAIPGLPNPPEFSAPTYEIVKPVVALDALPIRSIPEFEEQIPELAPIPIPVPVAEAPTMLDIPPMALPEPMTILPKQDAALRFPDLPPLQFAEPVIPGLPPRTAAPVLVPASGTQQSSANSSGIQSAEYRVDDSATILLTAGCESCNSLSTNLNCGTCQPMPVTGRASKVIAGLYEALCCPDPCYQPKWIPLADAAFFTSSARPVSQTRLRWEYGRFGMFPDRAEYFWARADGNGKGPSPVAGVQGIPRYDYHELVQYTETAAGPGFSAYVVTPYRSINPTFSDPPSAAGFSDISIGTKSVLFDSELFLLTLQFQTTLPVGNSRKGLGTGHVALEPSLLFGLRVSPKSFLQGQISQWIPIAGDATYSGALLHYHMAYNHVLWQPIEQVQVIGTLEMHGFSFQDGGFTDPDGGFRSASGTNIMQMGPGIRMFFCDQYDFGVGSNFGITGKNSIQDLFRFEFRVRY